MNIQIVSILVLVGIFVVATALPVSMGVLAFAAPLQEADLSALRGAGCDHS